MDCSPSPMAPIISTLHSFCFLSSGSSHLRMSAFAQLCWPLPTISLTTDLFGDIGWTLPMTALRSQSRASLFAHSGWSRLWPR